jgi:hypothetical protein
MLIRRNSQVELVTRPSGELVEEVTCRATVAVSEWVNLDQSAGHDGSLTGEPVD